MNVLCITCVTIGTNALFVSHSSQHIVGSKTNTSAPLSLYIQAHTYFMQLLWVFEVVGITHTHIKHMFQLLTPSKMPFRT
ncbi:hypothetical protein Hanom_Chr01g00003251 [Helianthus anomalus]